MSVRLRRLKAEFEQLVSLFANHKSIRIVETAGNPPDRYVIEYRVRGLVEEKGEIKEQHLHRAQITLGQNYPRERPRCVMLTPLFHPNIDHLAICTEDIGAAGQTLDRTVVFIGEMITYQAFNLQSPRNGDAARWTAENPDKLPLEGTDLMPTELMQGSALAGLSFADASWTAAAEPPLETAATQASISPDTAVKVCANCHQAQPLNNLQPCVNGHAVCVDCSLTCRNCQETLCVLCDVQPCAKCQSFFCEGCIMACDGCQALTCLVHIRQCQLCQRWQCLNSCAAFCGVCGAAFCRAEVNEAHRCIA